MEGKGRRGDLRTRINLQKDSSKFYALIAFPQELSLCSLQ